MKKEFFNPYFLVSFLVIQLYLFVLVFIPFLTLDKLQSWDSTGHLFAAWFNRTYLFPNYTGWNPFFYAGYPQDTFYPPLYHYLIVLLSFILGLELSLKLIAVAATFILPLSFYYFARKFSFSHAESALIMFLMMVPIASVNLITGGNLYGTFVIGLGANVLALPFLFFFIGKLRDEPSSRNAIVPAILFAAMLLSHFIVAQAAIIVAAIFAVFNFRKEYLLHLFKIFALAFLLCGFWLAPLLYYIGYYGGADVRIDLTSFITLPVLILLVAGLCLAVLEKEEKIMNGPLIVLITVFAILAFVDFGEYGIPSQPYRFIIYFLILAMILPYKLIFNRSRGHFKTAFILLLVVLLSYHFYKIYEPGERARVDQNWLYRYADNHLHYGDLNIGRLDGRTIVFGGDQAPHIHDLRHLIAMDSKDLLLKGLFIESSINGKFIVSLDKNAIRSGFVWGVDDVPMAKEQYLTNDPVVLQKNLDLFDVNYLLINDVRPPLIPERKIMIETNKPSYNLYRIGNSKLVELLTYRPVPVDDGSWAEDVKTWFRSENNKVLVKGSDIPVTVAGPKDNVAVLEENEQQTYLKLKVDSRDIVPIFIKISYFPRWKAYVNGKQTRIYVASPYLMLVYGKGIVELKYENSPIDNIGWIISIFGILGLYFLSKKDTA